MSDGEYSAIVFYVAEQSHCSWGGGDHSYDYLTFTQKRTKYQEAPLQSETTPAKENEAVHYPFLPVKSVRQNSLGFP